jgi:DNA-binding response OmpR family regulator
MGVTNEVGTPAATERAPDAVDRGAALIWVASPELRAAVELVLQRDGFRVVPVSSALLLVQLLAPARSELPQGVLPTLVVVDVGSADDGGLEVTASVRQLAPGVRILALVGRLERAVAMKAYRLGASRVIAKPVSLDALHRAALSR